MSLLETRGGFPRVRTVTAPTTGYRHSLGQYCKYIQLYPITNPALVYFTEKDYNDGVNALTVAVDGSWEGPADIKELWFKGSGGNSVVTVVAFLRRG